MGHNIKVHNDTYINELNISICPRILLIHLNTKIYSSLRLNKNILDELRKCSLNGSYIVFAFNNNIIADDIWKNSLVCLYRILAMKLL